MSTVRQYTNTIYDLMDNGVLDAKAVAEMCLKYMSEDDVKDMYQANCLTEVFDPEADEEEVIDDGYDDDVTELQEWYDYDPDC